MTVCKSCGAAILWVRNIDTGSMMPVNFPLKTQIVVADDMKRGAVRKCGESHFATCPDASAHRKRKKN